LDLQESKKKLEEIILAPNAEVELDENFDYLEVCKNWRVYS